MISVITVCMNARSCIQGTVDSILKQDDNNFQFILIDGKSTDGTVSLVQKLIQEDSFPLDRYICVSEPDRGIYDAMNKGVSIAKGGYIIFLNAGDSFYNNSVITQFETLIKNNEADAYYGNTLMVFYEGEGVLQEHEGSKRNPVMPFIHQSVIVRRELLLQHKFNTTYRILADYELFYWMRNQRCTFVYSDFIVSRYNAKEGA